MSTITEVDELLALITSAAKTAVGEYAKAGAAPPSLDSTEPLPTDTAKDLVALKKTIRLLEGACNQLCTMLAPPAHTIVNYGQNFDAACLRVAAQCRIADVLFEHKDGLHIRDISRIVSIEEGKLGRILRLLATRHCFREVQENVFANNRLSVQLLSSEDMCEFVQLLTCEGANSAPYLCDNVTDPEVGRSYNAKDAPFMFSVRDEGVMGTYFDWQKLHPEKREAFGRAMVGMNRVIGTLEILQQFPFRSHSTLCDVGSGIGSFSIPLARKYQHMKITLQDLPAVIEQAKQHWEKEYPGRVRAGGIEFVPLDLFQECPVPGHDIYYLRNIVHNWPDEPALAILRSVRKAMALHSRLLIHDYVIRHVHKSAPDSDTALRFEEAPWPMLSNFGIGNRRMYNQDLSMLVMFNAKERSLQEIVELGNKADLKLQKAWDLGEMPVLEFGLITDA